MSVPTHWSYRFDESVLNGKTDHELQGQKNRAVKKHKATDQSIGNLLAADQ